MRQMDREGAGRLWPAFFMFPAVLRSCKGEKEEYGWFPGEFLLLIRFLAGQDLRTPFTKIKL